MALADRQWIIIRLRFRGPFVVLEYRDSLSRYQRASAEWNGGGGLERLLADLRAGEKLAAFPNANFPPAIFIDVHPRAPQRMDLARRTAFLLAQPQLTPAIFTPVKRFARPPFRLPFGILACGPEASDSLSLLQEEDWLRAEDLSEFGMEIRETHPRDLDRALRRQADIVIARDPRLLFRECLNLEESLRPRLAIVLEPDPERPFAGNIPPGLAVLRVGIAEEAAVQAFIRALVHDNPLHVAAYEASEAAGITGTLMLELIANPLSNHSLRLFDAFLALKHGGEREQPRLRIARSAFESVLSPDKRPDSELLYRANVASERVVGPGDFSFAHETEGLVPMAQWRRAQHEAAELAQLLRDSARTEAAPAPSPEEAPNDERRVIVGLRRLESYPELSDVEPAKALLPNRVYELRVSIGLDAAGNLVVGEQPAIAPLLPPQPDEEPHLLDVTIQAKRFTLHTERTQQLILPRRGDSPPVYFRILAPAEAGLAELRICLYCRNSLVQSYILRADIVPAPFPTPMEQDSANGIAVTLEYSRNPEEPWDLAPVRDRLVSLGINQGGESHQVIVKGRQIDTEIQLSPDRFNTELASLRSLMDSMVVDSSGRERNFPEVDFGNQLAADVADTFRELAWRGNQLYRAFLGRVSRDQKLKKALIEIAKTTGEKVQVVRFHDEFTFPWTLLYDFPLPLRIAGAVPPDVCLGWRDDGSGNLVECGHTFIDEVYCVRGFWGIRHQVEERFVQAGGTVASIAKPSKDTIRLLADPNLAETPTLTHDLSALDPLCVSGPCDETRILDLLWHDPPERPAALVFLGHLEKQDRYGEPQGPRVALDNSAWLTLQRLGQRVATELEWASTRPLIFQMTCESADVDIDTLNHFLLEWKTAGAGAIIGTEARVGSALAARCAKELLSALWNSDPLGTAMLEFRRSLAFRGNPLAFLFTAYGDVDLTVQ